MKLKVLIAFIIVIIACISLFSRNKIINLQNEISALTSEINQLKKAQAAKVFVETKEEPKTSNLNTEILLKDNQKQIFNKLIDDYTQATSTFIIGSDEGEALAFYQFEKIKDLGNNIYEITGKRYYGNGMELDDEFINKTMGKISDYVSMPFSKMDSDISKILSRFETEDAKFKVVKSSTDLYGVIPNAK